MQHNYAESMYAFVFCRVVHGREVFVVRGKIYIETLEEMKYSLISFHLRIQSEHAVCVDWHVMVMVACIAYKITII